MHGSTVQFHPLVAVYQRTPELMYPRTDTLLSFFLPLSLLLLISIIFLLLLLFLVLLLVLSLSLSLLFNITIKIRPAPNPRIVGCPADRPPTDLQSWADIIAADEGKLRDFSQAGDPVLRPAGVEPAPLVSAQLYAVSSGKGFSLTTSNPFFGLLVERRNPLFFLSRKMGRPVPHGVRPGLFLLTPAKK